MFLEDKFKKNRYKLARLWQRVYNKLRHQQISAEYAAAAAAVVVQANKS